MAVHCQFLILVSSLSHKLHHCLMRLQESWATIVCLKDMGTYWWLWLVPHNNYWFHSLDFSIKKICQLANTWMESHSWCAFYYFIFLYFIWQSFGFWVILEMWPKITLCKCYPDFLCTALYLVLLEKCETWMVLTGCQTNGYGYHRKWDVIYVMQTNCSNVVATKSLFSGCLTQVISCLVHTKRKRFNSKENKQLVIKLFFTSK